MPTATGWHAELLLSSGSLRKQEARSEGMVTVNRSAIVVMPAQPLLEWLHDVDPRI